MTVPNAREVRAEVLMSDLRLYEVAARVGINPQRLGQMLRGRVPLTEHLAERIREVIRESGE